MASLFYPKGKTPAFAVQSDEYNANSLSKMLYRQKMNEFTALSNYLVDRKREEKVAHSQFSTLQPSYGSSAQDLSRALGTCQAMPRIPSRDQNISQQALEQSTSSNQYRIPPQQSSGYCPSTSPLRVKPPRGQIAHPASYQASLRASRTELHAPNRTQEEPTKVASPRIMSSPASSQGRSSAQRSLQRLKRIQDCASRLSRKLSSDLKTYTRDADEQGSLPRSKQEQVQMLWKMYGGKPRRESSSPARGKKSQRPTMPTALTQATQMLREQNMKLRRTSAQSSGSGGKNTSFQQLRRRSASPARGRSNSRDRSFMSSQKSRRSRRSGASRSKSPINFLLINKLTVDEKIGSYRKLRQSLDRLSANSRNQLNQSATLPPLGQSLNSSSITPQDMKQPTPGNLFKVDASVLLQDPEMTGEVLPQKKKGAGIRFMEFEHQTFGK